MFISLIIKLYKVILTLPSATIIGGESKGSRERLEGVENVLQGLFFLSYFNYLLFFFF